MLLFFVGNTEDLRERCMKELYLKKADMNLPKLNEKPVFPETTQHILDKNDTIVIDLGNHYVGYFSFKYG